MGARAWRPQERRWAGRLRDGGGAGPEGRRRAAGQAGTTGDGDGPPGRPVAHGGVRKPLVRHHARRERPTSRPCPSPPRLRGAARGVLPVVFTIPRPVRSHAQSRGHPDRDANSPIRTSLARGSRFHRRKRTDAKLPGELVRSHRAPDRDRDRVRAHRRAAEHSRRPRRPAAARRSAFPAPGPLLLPRRTGGEGGDGRSRGHGLTARRRRSARRGCR